MSLQRISSRFPTTLLARRLNSLLFANSVPHTSNHFLLNFPIKVVAGQVSPLHRLSINSPVLQQYGFSSSATAETEEKRTDSGKGVYNTERKSAAAESSADAEVADQKEASSSEGPEDSEEELTREDLIKLVFEKDELLKVKHKDIENMQEKVLRSYAEMENVMDRTRREAENSKKFAIQSFAKGLLDVADNLGRASSVVKESFSKIDTSKDGAGASPLLKTLLEGVEMTEKQLTEVFRKFGVEKYDPTGEQFDPNRHNAVFQVPDASKPPGTVAVVLKSGYVLHDRIIRPAEVGVTEAVENTETDQSSKE